ncbi:hypothetical protein FA15DRAFT_693754 [Coprinopsis marcescibilis]|uniref:Mediator of RNA polymerase II transcription subunit 12 n=1 Tax=Coprinopsis marcescibilis TaxID=230819 RepID=A0A5C3LB91_COPMA|nr:hypothetical protein FA15DRAFT_693754 [Coprinopsis marcescibilis]
MGDKKDDTPATSELQLYESQPPKWLPTTHGGADLGYPGFYPPRPGQDEDVLSASSVKNGFVLPQPVSVETFSAQSMINEKLRGGDTLFKLEDLMNEVFIRRADHTPHIPPSSFRMPTRVTLNEPKRQAWFADLANPEVPLYKLGKSVPHGAKGHDLLDLLQSHDVAIPRAVWVLRVFGANETAGLRNRPSYNPTQYSVEWANVVTGYLKKQLYEIALPSAPRPGLNIKQTFKGVLSEHESRERWISRFAYSLKLLRTFYHEGLVDGKTFLAWLVQQMAVCNLAQAGFITRLVDEYLDDILEIRPLARPLAEACLSKVAEIKNTSAQDILVHTELLLKTLLQRLCLGIPDVFIGPRIWVNYSALVEKTMSENLLDLPVHSNDQQLRQNAEQIQGALINNMVDIRKRNEALSFRNCPPKVSAKLSIAVSGVKLLNSLSSDTPLSNVVYFDTDAPSDSFGEKLDMLLTWSVTPLQYGNHRPLATVTLIQQWCTRACERATRRGHQHPYEFLQDHLFEWLDTSDVANEPGNIQTVALLYGKLVKLELFSYPNYIQRLIARGETGLASTDATPSRHRKFLSWIPLLNSTPSLIYQRKVTLYGARVRESPEERTEKEIRREIRAILPELFGGSAAKGWPSTTALLDDCKSLVAASRYEQVRTFRQWLLPAFQKAVAASNDHAVLLRAYNTCIELMDYAKCFNSILEMALCMSRHSLDVESLTGVIDTFQRFATIWTCMDATSKIMQALDITYQRWKGKGLQSRGLLSLLLEFDNGQYLPQSSRDQIIADMSAFINALHPVSENPGQVPSTLPEVHSLAFDSTPDAPSTLANSLWIKYRTSQDWAAKAWENTIASLQTLGPTIQDKQEGRVVGLRYANFLWKVDQHLPTGLDEYVLRWLATVGTRDMPLLQPATWSLLESILIFLVIQGSLKTTTILSGLVYPAWQLAASTTVTADSPLFAYLRSAHALFQQLLLQYSANDDGAYPRDIFDIQRLRTRRRTVYYEPHFSKLVDMIPLLIYLDAIETLPQELREEMSSLRWKLCQDRRFRQGAYRNLDVIRAAFETSPYLMNADFENLRKDAVAGLRMILWDSVDDGDFDEWPEVSSDSLLSPWKLAATTIQMQFQVKQLGRALGQENTHELANYNLDKLILKLFQHTKTAEEAYYVGEMTRGADLTVAMKFIKAGLNFMKDIIWEAQTEEESFTGSLKRLGELLRILIHVTAPFRDQPTTAFALDSSLQEQFLQVLRSRISFLEGSILSVAQQTHTQIDNLMLLVRLLQFILNFREPSWSPAMKETGRELAAILYRLVIHFGSGSHINDCVVPILMDTLFFIYDGAEMAPDPRAPSYDPFKHYPDATASSLSPDLPAEYRRQILTLITRHPTISTVSNLATAYRDSQGALIHTGPVANRPWEWVENLGEPTLDFKEEDEGRTRFRNKDSVKNSGSLPLELFGARLTSDSIVNNLSESHAMDNNLRIFEDGLSSESMFARDWRESRCSVNRDDIGDLLRAKFEGSQGVHSMNTDIMKLEYTSRGSPASSGSVSRSSARLSGSSRRQSPSQASRMSTSTMSDSMDVDAIASAMNKGGISKRKVDEEDEFEMDSGSMGVSPTTNKRTRAGKAPAGKSMKPPAAKTRASARKR